MAMPMFELPDGVQHGTPEGFTAGCRLEKQCPALHTHGMCCLYAHVRSQTDPRYYKAKVRDPRPAAIAMRLGIRPPKPTAAAEQEAIDAEFAQRPADYRWKKRYDRHVEQPTDQPPVNNPDPTDSAASAVVDEPAPGHPSTKPEPAQPLAEQSQDPEPQEDAGAPVIEEQTPSAGTSGVEGEGMGHPSSTTTTTTSEEPTVTTTPTDERTELERRCAEAIATAPGRKKIRDWAAAQGFVVARNGRIPTLFVRSFVLDQHPDLADQVDTDAEALHPSTPTPTPDVEPADLPPIPDTDPVDGTPSAEDEAPEPSDQTLDTVGILTPEQPEDLVVDVDINIPPIFAEEPDEEITEGEVLASEFRPDWAGVTIPADVRAARAIAARLEEENARLTAEYERLTTNQNRLMEQLREAKDRELALRDAADQEDDVDLRTARDLAVRALSAEETLRQIDNDNHHAVIAGLERKLSTATELAEFRGRLLIQGLQETMRVLVTNRELREQLAKPFWRRRR